MSDPCNEKRSSNEIQTADDRTSAHVRDGIGRRGALLFSMKDNFAPRDLSSIKVAVSLRAQSEAFIR